jgi:hypothetical protein
VEKLKDLNMKKNVSVLFLRCRQFTELKWHTNVKEAIALVIKSTSL